MTDLHLNTATLNTALSALARVAPRRPAVPALGGLHLQVLDGQAHLTAVDYESRLTCMVPVDHVDVPPVLLPRRLLTAAVRQHNRAGVSTVSFDSGAVTVSQLRRTLRMPATLTLEDYPTLPDPGSAVLRFLAGTLRDLVTSVLPAVDRGDTLPVLTMVDLTAEDGTATAAATDRYRLAVRAFPVEAGPAPLHVLIPGHALQEAARLAGRDPVTLGVHSPEAAGKIADPPRLTFDAPGFRLDVHAGNAEYPKYQSLFPAQPAASAVVNSAELISEVRAIEAAYEGGQGGYRAVRLNFTPAELLVTSGLPDGDTEASGAVDLIEGNLDGCSVALNPAFLIAAVRSCSSQTVRISTSGVPVLFTPGEQTDNALRHLVMPVRTADSDRKAA